MANENNSSFEEKNNGEGKTGIIEINGDQLTDNQMNIEQSAFFKVRQNKT